MHAAPPELCAEVEIAVRRLGESFPTKLEPGHAGCYACDSPTEDEKLAQKQFYAVIRAHRKSTQTLPIRMLTEFSFGHGPAVIHGSFRRFAYFVPALLVQVRDEVLGGRKPGLEVPGRSSVTPEWTVTQDGPSDSRDPDALERVVALFEEAVETGRCYGEDTTSPWTDAERAALSDFLAAVLAARLSSAPPSTFEAIALTNAAAIMQAIAEKLVVVWSSAAAEQALLESSQWSIQQWQPFRHALRLVAHDRVLQSLEERFHATTVSDHAHRLSNAEQALRRLRTMLGARRAG